MFRLLNQPYPLEDNVVAKIKSALISGLVVGLFLWVFRPFDINATPVSSLAVFIFGYGLVTAVLVALMLFGMPLMFRKYYSEECWTVGKNILFFLLIVFVIGTANLYYTHLSAGMNLSVESFLIFQFYTLSVSFVVASASTLLKYSFNLKQYSDAAKVVTEELRIAETDHNGFIHQDVTENKSFTLRSENDKEEITLTADTLLYIESADNYSQVCFLNNHTTEHTLIRSSLRRIEEMLNQPFAIRCHRSFIVNLNMVQSVSGNSQGYKLHLRHSDKTIPVSRRLNESIIEKLKSTRAAETGS